MPINTSLPYSNYTGTLVSYVGIGGNPNSQTSIECTLRFKPSPLSAPISVRFLITVSFLQHDGSISDVLFPKGRIYTEWIHPRNYGAGYTAMKGGSGKENTAGTMAEISQYFYRSRIWEMFG